MDRKTIFTKTAKGLMEAKGQTSALPRDLRNILKEVDGRTNVGQLSEDLGKMPEASLLAALAKMERDGYVREFVTAEKAAGPPSQSPVPSGGEDLDFTSLTPKPAPKPDVYARRKTEAEEMASQAAAARAAAEAAAKARAEAEAKSAAESKARAEAEARARALAEQKARAEAETRARAVAEAKARAEAETRARLAAEQKARAESEAKARADTDARAKREAEEKARREVEERARREAEEKARRATEEKERREAEERARVEGELKAKLDEARRAREAEERARREVEEKARREADELRAQLEAERKAREEAERRAKAEADAKAKAEAEAKEREQAEARRREDEQRRAKEEEERRVRAEAERRAKAEAEAKAKAEAEAKEREQAEARRREEEQRRAKEEEARRAREESERRAKAEAEAKAKAEAEAKEREQAEARRREEEQRRAKEDEERKGREEAERRARADAEAKEREEAEARRREEEQRRAREEEERRAREDAERRAKAESDARAKVEAEAKEREEAESRRREEEQHREDEERRAREDHRADDQEAEPVAKESEKQADSKARARLEAEAAAQARKEARARERARTKGRKEEEREEERQEAEPLRPLIPEPVAEARPAKFRKPRNWARIMSLGMFIILVGALAAIHVMPIDVLPYEKAAQERLGEPVRIGAIRFSLLPRPHLSFEKITIGTDPALKIAVLTAVPEFGTMFDSRKVFKSVEISGLVLPAAFASRVLWGKGSDEALRVERVIANKLKFELRGMALPPLDADAVFGPAGLEKAQLSNSQGDLSVMLRQDGGKTQIEIEAKQLALPFAETIVLDGFSGKGTLGPQELTLREAEVRAYDGILSGNARLAWRDTLSFDGEFTARGMDAAKLAAPVLSGGRLEGKGVYSMKGADPEKLVASARLEGSYSVQKGTLGNIDLTRLLQGGSGSGGSTLFSEMNGSFLADANRIQLRQIRLSAGLLNATGSAEIDAQKNLSGRMQIELRAQTSQARATLAISGKLDDPQFRRSN